MAVVRAASALDPLELPAADSEVAQVLDGASIFPLCNGLGREALCADANAFTISNSDVIDDCGTVKAVLGCAAAIVAAAVVMFTSIDIAFLELPTPLLRTIVFCNVPGLPHNDEIA